MPLIAPARPVNVTSAPRDYATAEREDLTRLRPRPECDAFAPTTK